MACFPNKPITFSLLDTHRVQEFEKSAERSTAERQIHAHRLGIRSRPGSALAQGNAIVRQPGGHRVQPDAFTRFAHQVAERRQRHQLAVGEQVGPGLASHRAAVKTISGRRALRFQASK